MQKHINTILGSLHLLGVFFSPSQDASDHQNKTDIFKAWGFRTKPTHVPRLHPAEPHPKYKEWKHIWLVVSTHLKKISQLGSFPQIWMKIKNNSNHHPDIFRELLFLFPFGSNCWLSTKISYKKAEKLPHESSKQLDESTHLCHPKTTHKFKKKREDSPIVKRKKRHGLSLFLAQHVMKVKPFCPFQIGRKAPITLMPSEKPKDQFLRLVHPEKTTHPLKRDNFN